MTRRGVALVTAAVLTVSACQANLSPPSGVVDPPVAAVAAPVAAAGCRVVDGKADARCTPGVVNPQVTALNLASTICRKGWTATVRPPVSVTNRLKAEQMPRYGETGPASSVEEDHLIPLELGGSPTDPANLWPEPYAGARGAKAKDAAENSLNRAVCGGRMKLADAQAAIRRDWVHP